MQLKYNLGSKDLNCIKQKFENQIENFKKSHY